MPQNVLVITWTGDHRKMLDDVRAAVEARGARYHELHTDRFPMEHSATQRTVDGEERFFINLGEGPVELTASDAVWYRRMRLGQGMPKDMEPGHREGAMAETREMFEGWLTALPCFMVDRFEAVRRARRKSWQQVLARKVGLNMPRTCLTNDPDEARAFLDSCADGAIAKMLANWAWFDEAGREHVVMTTKVDETTLNHLDGLRLSPLQFQELVPKSHELRVTVMGTRVFSARIDSQQIEGAELDWRNRGAQSRRDWTEEASPPDVQAKLLALMDHTGLQYSAADFIVTPEGEHVFLEANTSGEWFWLEAFPPHFPLAASMADLLTDAPGARRPIPVDPSFSLGHAAQSP